MHKGRQPFEQLQVGNVLNRQNAQQPSNKFAKQTVAVAGPFKQMPREFYPTQSRVRPEYRVDMTLPRED